MAKGRGTLAIPPWPALCQGRGCVARGTQVSTQAALTCVPPMLRAARALRSQGRLPRRSRGVRPRQWHASYAYTCDIRMSGVGPRCAASCFRCARHDAHGQFPSDITQSAVEASP